MNTKFTLCLLFLIFAGCVGLKNAQQNKADFYREAIGHFSNGRFEEAGKSCIKMLRRNPEDWRAHFLLANIAYMQNNLSSAQTRLEKVISLAPHNPKAKLLLAMVYYRQNKFRQSARLFSDIGEFAKAETLLKIKSPYLIEAKTTETIVDFEFADPLPVIEVTVNQSFTTFFLIDTTRAEVSLSKNFAKRVGIKILSRKVATLLGAGKQTIAYGKIESLKMGEFSIHNIPVVIYEHKFPPQIYPDIEIEGIIGIDLLYQFLVTLDFKNECLILRTKQKDVLEKFENKTGRESVIIPFRMSPGGHFILVSGSINRARPMLFLLSTGLAGCDFTGPESVLKETKVNVDEDKKVLFSIDEIAVGKIKKRDLIGAKRVFPAQLEYISGVRICGILSHRFFSGGIITFDFVNFRIFVKPPIEPV
jgi:hypothetical protein